jgi:ABC-type Fe3+-hydroxamate transport system substrate-binding protein
VKVVSLVPSATETLVALGVPPVAVTRFCDRPGVPTVGGTKNPDVDAIVALAPDLVVVNDEENRAEDAAALEDAGLRLHSMSPRRVEDVDGAVRALATALGTTAPRIVVPTAALTRSGVIATWRRPYMTCNRDTYGSSVLEHLGISNVYADAEARYPEVMLEEIAARTPDVVLLPDEPYPFAPRHVPEVEAAVPGARVVIVDGRDMFWWGVRTPDALARLAEVV